MDVAKEKNEEMENEVDKELSTASTAVRRGIFYRLKYKWTSKLTFLHREKISGGTHD